MVRISEAVLKRLSTGVLDGITVLYFRNNYLICGWLDFSWWIVQVRQMLLQITLRDTDRTRKEVIIILLGFSWFSWRIRRIHFLIKSQHVSSSQPPCKAAGRYESLNFGCVIVAMIPVTELQLHHRSPMLHIFKEIFKYPKFSKYLKWYLKYLFYIEYLNTLFKYFLLAIWYLNTNSI